MQQEFVINLVGVSTGRNTLGSPMLGATSPSAHMCATTVKTFSSFIKPAMASSSHDDADAGCSWTNYLPASTCFQYNVQQKLICSTATSGSA